jgi:cytolysin (calcineurin-like family phosphatase)
VNAVNSCGAAKWLCGVVMSLLNKNCVLAFTVDIHTNQIINSTANSLCCTVKNSRLELIRDVADFQRDSVDNLKYSNIQKALVPLPGLYGHFCGQACSVLVTWA